MSEDRKPVIVLGAGVAGLSAAVFLQRAGCAVTVVDPLGPAGGAYFGMTGGPPSGRLVSALVTGAAPPIDARPYAITRFSRARAA